MAEQSLDDAAPTLEWCNAALSVAPFLSRNHISEAERKFAFFTDSSCVSHAFLIASARLGYFRMSAEMA